MNKKIATVSIATICVSASAHSCDKPSVPLVPDGTTASYEFMVEAQEAVKAFQLANREYLNCMEDIIQTARDDVSTGDKFAEGRFSSATSSYNQSVEQEEELAAAFNSAIRAYKLANP